MKARFYIDESGSPRAECENSFELLGNFLESDVQGSAAYCEEILKMIDHVSIGKPKKWRSTGNAHTITLTPEEVCIEAEFDDAHTPLRLSLDMLKTALIDWKALVDD
jgi:uncharacterized protein YacL (UPF0231 family)